MKKALVILLILAVAGGAFAQDLTWTGSAKSGMAFVLGNEDLPNGEKHSFSVFSMDSEDEIEVNLTANWTNADKTAGLKFAVDGISAPDSANDWDVNFGNFAIGAGQMYGWTKFADGLFTLYGGKMDDSMGFGTPGVMDTGLGIGTGVGLFGVAAFGPLSVGVSFLDTFYSSEFKYGDYTFGAKFDMADMLSAVALLGFKGYEPDEKTVVSAAAGATISALSSMGITVIVDALFDNINKVNIATIGETMKIGIGEKVKFKAGDLEVYGAFAQRFLSGDGADANDYVPDLNFEVGGSFGLGSITPSVAVAFNIGSGFGAADPLHSAYGDSQFTEDCRNMLIHPKLRFAVTENTNLDFGWKLNMDLSDYPDSYNGVTVFNTIYLDYLISF